MRKVSASDFCISCDNHLSEFCWSCHNQLERQRDDLIAACEALIAHGRFLDPSAATVVGLAKNAIEKIKRAESDDDRM